MSSSAVTDPSSFRDPSGFIFWHKNQLYRQINHSFQPDFTTLIDSGLYQQLTSKHWLIPHKEVPLSKFSSPKLAYKILKPELIPVITYPYEWSFSQLQKAALLTLKIHQTALAHNMILKDASAYNIQFIGTNPIFIDTLSFQTYQPDLPWIAYRQFCQHFLAPLSLMALVDIRLNSLLKIYLDGVPLDITSKMLPISSKLNFGLLAHIHANATSQTILSQQTRKSTLPKLSKSAHLNLITNLINTTKSLKLKVSKTTWSNYYQETNYTQKSFASKKSLVRQFVQKTKPKRVLDLGANTGEFTKIADKIATYTISADIDPLAVEHNFLSHHPTSTILPLTIDLTNPSADSGWANQERLSFSKRAYSDTVLALALIHHLAIANNLPFGRIASYFSTLGKHLIIEFVPKSDSQTQKLLSQRPDIFPHYNQTEFQTQFSKYFSIIDSKPITNSKRTLFLMRSLNS